MASLGATDARNGSALATVARLPALGFGAAAIGNLYAAVDDATALQVLDTALAAGLTYVDTAPHYGFGLSETRVGAALAGHTEVLVSTKVGRTLVPVAGPAGERHGFVDAAPFEPVFDYGYDAVMRGFEDSLVRLGRERVDILLAHDLGRATHGDDHPAHWRAFFEGGYRALRALRDSGVVGAIGLGVNEAAACRDALADGDFDVFLLAGRYTLLEQEPLDGLLPQCLARGVAVVVGGPFNSGALVEPAGAGQVAHYNYQPAPPAVMARVQGLRTVCQAHQVPLAAAALQFPLAHPAVASVIPGLASAAQVREAVQGMALDIPAGLWSDLKGEGLLHPDAPTPPSRRAA